MSNISNIHAVVKFDAKTSKAFSGQRLAKVGYKSTAKNPAKYPSVCASVPFIGKDDVIGKVEQLLPAIISMLQNAQDGIVRSLYESSQGTLAGISDADISIDACIGYMEAENSGGRLTKEYIEAWFDSNVKEYVFALIGEKLGFFSSEDNDTNIDITIEQETVIGKHVTGYRDLYSSLAGGKTILQPVQIKSLLKVIELVGNDGDSVSDKLVARLNGMNSKPKIEELLEL